MSRLSEQRSDSPSADIASVANNLESLEMDPIQSDRPNSAHSHRSKESNWCSIDQPNVLYVQAMLRRLLNGDFDGTDTLPIKRVYHQLDWRDRGYLFRTDVERQCNQAIADAPYTLSDEKLRKLVHASDSNRNGKRSTRIYKRLPTISDLSNSYLYFCTMLLLETRPFGQYLIGLRNVQIAIRISSPARRYL